MGIAMAPRRSIPVLRVADGPDSRAAITPSRGEAAKMFCTCQPDARRRSSAMAEALEIMV